MLTFIIVNYNSARYTLGLLKSLEAQTDQDFDVMVVDNDSRPEDRALLGQYATGSPLKLDLIYSETNRGYSGGNNLAIRKGLAQGVQWFLIINPDTTVPADFVASLILPEKPAIVGLPLWEGDRTAFAGQIRWLHRTLKHLCGNDQFSMTNFQLLYAIGAGMLIHRDVFAKVGLLDERYFLYFEDADFSLRARRAGAPIVFAEAPVIHHGVSQITKSLGAPLLLYYHARNALLFNSLHGPGWVRLLLPLAAAYGIILQSAKILLMPSRRAQSRAIRAGILDFYAHRFGKIQNN